jgi:hypothetical protein
LLTRQELDFYKGGGWLPREKMSQAIRNAREGGLLTDDWGNEYGLLGVSDEDTEIGLRETVIFAKYGSYRYIPNNKGE